MGVIVNTPGLTGPTHFGHYVYFGIRDIAAGTGGDSLDTNDAAGGLHETIQRPRQRYSLYYALPPVKPGEERRVQVQLTREARTRHPRAVIRARTGYIAPL